MSLKEAQFLVSAGSLLVTITGAIVAWLTFRNAQRWKSAEFLATEMKSFFSDPKVQIALQLVDWGRRDLRILPQGSRNDGYVLVDRALQVSALLPHTLAERGFSQDEAAIRDHYDALLDPLERMANYLSTGLVRVKDLRPYIGYWVDTISMPQAHASDAAWAAALMTYIQFYGFIGVLRMFKEFGHPIDATSDSYRDCLAKMTDRKLADAFQNCARLVPFKK